MRTIRTISLILLIFLLVGIASASEDVNFFNNTTNITFEGVNFTIPQGFGELKDAQDFDELGSEGKTCFYINEAGGEIQITAKTGSPELINS